MSSRRNADNKNRVEFIGSEMTEYIPAQCARSPLNTSVSRESTKDKMFLDEIALLKRGKIDKERMSERRMARDSNTNLVHTGKPITQAEIAQRGLVNAQGRVVYGMSSSSSPASSHSDVSSKSGKSAKSAKSTKSAKACGSATSVLSKTSLHTLYEPSHSDTVYAVGDPSENAELKISKLSEGVRYELSINKEEMCILQHSKKSIMLIAWKQ